MLSALASIALVSVQAGAAQGNTETGASRTSPIGQARDMFPPWEGSGVYVFYPYRLDLNHGRESWVPTNRNGIRDCTNGEFFCLSARLNNRWGLIHVVAPRRCVRPLAARQQWQVGEVRTKVLAAIRTNDPPLQMHGRRPEVIHFLGDDSNPNVVYEYWGAEGIIAIHHGLIGHPNLVSEVRSGFDPFTLPQQHRLALVTFDRFAACRYR